MRSFAASFALKPDTNSTLYRAWGRFGLSVCRPARPIMLLVLISVSVGGCSISRFDSGFAKRDDDLTGSISPVVRVDSPATPSETDLAFARNAASDVLTRGDKDASQPWENPETGARGSVTPLAQAYSSEGRTCRDFLASYVKGASESWLQGAACQRGRGQWEIHSLKPWRQS